MVQSTETTLYWPLLVYAGAVILLVITMLSLSYILGEKHKEKTTGEQFESGIKITGNARVRFSSHFYIVAMFFVIFDLEAVFIISWAIAFKELGWFGYTGAAIFIGLLAAVLVYEWRIGALDFGPDGKKIIKNMRANKERNYS